MSVRAASVAVLALLAAASPALAHGGQYKSPGPTGGIPPDSRILDPRVATPTPETRGEMTPWERWWDVHRDRLLDLRARLRARDGGRATATSGTGGVARTGDGAPANGAGWVVPKPADPRAFFEKEVLPAVTRALRDPDAEVRSAAVLALGKLGFPRSILDLRRAREDRVRDVREAAVLATGMLRDSLSAEDLRDVLLDAHEEPRVRAFAALGLGFVGGDEAGEALLGFLASGGDSARSTKRRPEIDACVVTALGMARHGPARETLRAMFASGEGGSRGSVGSFAAPALARMGDRDSLPILLQGLEGDAEPLRQAAALALGVLGKADDAAVTAALGKAALGDRDANTRALATMALARIGGGFAQTALRRRFKDADRPDLPFAALALAVIKDAESIPAIRAAFREERDPRSRGGLALALGLLGDRDSAADIRALVARGERPLRVHAMTALGILKDEASAPVLRGVLVDDRDPEVKLAAGLALGLLQDREAVPLLLRLSKEGSNLLLRGSACRILGAIGNEEAARALLGYATDQGQPGMLRMFAVVGLGMLGERSDLPLLGLPGLDNLTEVRVDPLDEIASFL